MTLTGDLLKDIALDSHEVTYADWLLEARRAAWKHAREYGEVCADDVHRLTPLPKWAHHNAMGAVFKTRFFEQIGWKASQRRDAHARTIRVYRAVGGK